MRFRVGFCTKELWGGGRVSGLNLLTVVYVGERLRALISEIVARNQIHSVELRNLNADRDILQSLDLPADSKTVLIIHPKATDDVVRLVSVLCESLSPGASLRLISEDEFHHPVITSLTGASCAIFPPDVSPEQMEREILRFLEQEPSQEPSQHGDDKQGGSEQSRFQRPSAREHVLACCRKLSPSELEVLCFILEGGMNRAIAGKLDVSERTVENRRRRIFETFGSHSVAVVTRMISETIGCDAVFRMRDEARG